jgi:hypothetical protein
MWSPGYLGFAAANHNGMLRMYEIFNQGGANTKKARLQGAQTTRQWFRPNPAAAGEVDWSIRNSINYAVSGVLAALELSSKFPAMIVENFARKSANSVEAGATRPPYAFVIPAGQRDQTAIDRVVNLLRRQAIEVHVADGADIKVKEGTFAAGSYIVRLNQPYGRLAKTLLEKQTYPDPALQTYDDSAWTMGYANNIEVKTIDDKSILDTRSALLTTDVLTRARIEGSSGATFVVKHTGALNLITLRYRLKDLPVRAARAAFKVGAAEFPAGSFVISGNESRVRQEIGSLGLVATAVSAAPSVETVDVDLPRIAIYTTWANTEKVGWVRLAFDRWEIPFDLIHKDHVKQANLRSKYDVIVVPHQGTSGKSLVYEQPKLSKPLPYKKNDTFKSLGLYAETDDVRGGMGLAGAAEFAAFVESGGLLLTFGVSSFFPAEFGLTRSVDAQTPSGTWYAPGPYVQTDILQPSHPVLYGYQDQKTFPMRWAGGPLLQVAGQAGPFGPAAPTGPETPTVLVRFQGGDAGVLSGLMRGADQTRNRPAVVDAPVGKGRVILYANNPIYRWQTFGEHGMVFNALLFHNDFPAPEVKSAAPTPQ